MGIIGNKFCMKITSIQFYFGKFHLVCIDICYFKTFQANMRHFLFDQFKSLSL